MSYFDTGNDPRFKFLEKYTEEILNLAKSKKLPGLRKDAILSSLEKLHKLAKNLRWSYLTKDQIIESDLMKEIINTAQEIRGQMEGKIKELEQKEPMFTKKLENLLDHILTLPERINLQDEPISAVELYYVKIISKEKHPKAGKLWITYVTNGRKNFRVVTNDPEVKPKDIVPMAYLPPREFMGIISEGMFIGGNGIKKERDESLIGKRPELDEKEKNNVLKEIFSYLE